jgi:hypothetical protein
MNNRRLKVNFWGKYEDELSFAVKENNKKRIRELFALSYLDYLDVILTPIENFGIKNEEFQNLSFTERFYLAFIKKGKPADIMNFPYSSDSYGSEVFIYFANELCLLLDEEVSSILLTENHYCRKVISKNLENLINRTFDERCSKSEKIKNFIENKPDFSFPPINFIAPVGHAFEHSWQAWIQYPLEKSINGCINPDNPNSVSEGFKI